MSDDLFDVIGAPPVDDTTAVTIVLRLHVQPGAGRSVVAGRYGDSLHVRVAPPPANGRANVACQELLAELFGLDKAAVELSSGDHSRDKRFKISGIAVGEARRRLEQAIDDAGRSVQRGRREQGRREQQFRH